jgi:hypothetical protein
MAGIVSTLSIDGLKGDIVAPGDRYTNMATWESAQQGFKGAGDTSTLNCYNDWATGYPSVVNIASWDSSAAFPIIVQAAVGEGIDGISNLTVPGSGFYMRSANFPMVLTSETVNFTNIEMISDNTNNTKAIADINTGSEGSVWSDCILTRTQTSPGDFTFVVDTNGIQAPGVTLVNIIAVGKLGITRGMRLQNTTLYNCLTDTANYGYFVSSNVTVIDCAAIGTGTNQFSGGYEVASSNCASSNNDALDDGIGTVVNVDTTAGVNYVDPANYDYRLSGIGSVLYDAGIPNPYTDDITGAPRS